MSGTGQPNQSGKGDRVRKAIDSGDYGDKVAFQDPSTAPLATDAEAAGIHDDATFEGGQQDSPPRPNDTNDPGMAPLVVWSVVIAVFAAAVIVAGWLAW